MSKFTHCRFATNVARAILACVVLAAISTMALAQAGHLDHTFANKGIFADSFSSGANFATRVALQSDGKIVVGGEGGNLGVVIRLNTNGTLDKSFGSGGVVSIKFSDVDNFATAVAVQNDGKIVVVGTGLPGRGQLDRLNSDGSFDTSFGNNGVVGLETTPGVLSLQSDGKILLTSGGGGTATSIVQRYETNGQLDTGFGTGGSAPLVGLGAIALQSDGKIMIPSTGFGLFAGLLARYNTNGSPDTQLRKLRPGILGGEPGCSCRTS